MAEQITLECMTSMFNEKAELRFRFNTFGNDMQAKRLAKCNDRPNNRRIVAVLSQVADKGLVNLELGKGELLQVAER